MLSVIPFVLLPALPDQMPHRRKIVQIEILGDRLCDLYAADIIFVHTTTQPYDTAARPRAQRRASEVIEKSGSYCNRFALLLCVAEEATHLEDILKVPTPP